MRKFVIIMFILFGTTVSFAGDIDWQQYMLDTTAPLFVMQDINPVKTKIITGPVKLKSPKKALFLSALVPGAGQAYGGSYLKAAGFFTLEVAGWAMYAVYTNKGNDIEDEFHAFADKHWIESDYWNWIAQKSDVDRNDMDALREWEHKNFSHGLHVNKDQQYYEMIGKYDQFNYGWDDSDIGLLDDTWNKQNPQRSKKRLYYEDKRDDSNRAFKVATTGTTIVMLNHIISAIEAAWGTSQQNKRVQTSLRFEPLYMNNQQYSALTFRLNW